MSCVIEWVITTIDGKKCKANGEKRPQSRGELTIAGLCLLCVCVCVCISTSMLILEGIKA